MVRKLFTMFDCNFIVSQIYTNVCEVLQKYYAMDYNFKNVVVINGDELCSIEVILYSSFVVSTKSFSSSWSLILLNALVIINCR